MLGHLGCNCRPPDAGKECRDGDDCQGVCLFDHVKIVQTPKPVRCGPRGCSVRLGRGVLVGRCSAQKVVFGCHARIAKGASREGPILLPAHVPSSCLD
jgi:hypothetical protein